MASPARTANAFVVDASVAAKWHLTDEEYAVEAATVLQHFGQGQIELLAPAQIRYEVPAAFTVATLGRNPRLTPPDGRAAIQEFLALGIKTIDDDWLILSAYDLSQQYGCALYDGLYLALSQGLGIPFITADRRLYQRIRHLPHAVWITDYSAAAS